MRIFKFSIIGFFIAAAVFACSNNASVNSVGPVEEKQTYKGVGVITKLDSASSAITINHSEIPGYMSAMEMRFATTVAVLPENLAVGDQINFVLERSGENVTVTSVAKIEGAPNGVKIYAENCAKCHGAHGEGETKGIPLISGHALNHSEEEYVQQVLDGETKKMPAFREKLTDEEIAAVVKFIREDLQKGATRSEGHKH